MNILLVAMACIFFFAYVISLVRKPHNFPPGPPWLPYVGTQFYIKRLTKSLGGLHRALAHLAQKYTTSILGLKFGNEYAICVSEHSLIREVLIRDDFEGRPNNFFFKMRSFGRPLSGITGSDGIVWSTNRNFVVHHFRSLGYGKQSMDQMIKTELEETIDVLKKDGTDIKIAKFLVPGILNILWRLVSGRRIPRSDKFLDELLDLIDKRAKTFDITGGILNQYPWLRFILPEWSGFNLIEEINTRLKGMIQRTIHEHYETWSEGRQDDLIYSYISEIKKGTNSVFCDEELVIICFDLFVAGTTTTSGTLESLLLMVLLHPEIQKKIQSEIDSKIDRNAILDYSNLTVLPYTNAVLMETQRYSHIFPISGPRRTMKDTTLGGYNIPKGTTILLDFYSMHYNKKYWKDPEVFRPERFLNTNGKLKQSENFMPFGLGKRRCLGDVLAKRCIFYFFVEIMRRFNVTFATEVKEGKEKFFLGVTLLSANFTAKFTER